MQRLVLIDGNAIIHRAYHALPALTTKDGQVVNAVYGFILMLLKVINDLEPTHLAVCFDRPEPTFRQEMYEQYQAQRPEMEEELSEQFPIVKEVVEAMKIPIFEKPGYEADDVIGTIANQVQSLKFKVQSSKFNKKKSKSKKAMIQWSNGPMEVIIVTGDRDILQLVDEQIKVYMPVKGLSQAKLFKMQDVEDKYGISPSQFVDYKALIGDPSDNYPGVSGVGPKTAAKLLSRYQNLEELYGHLDEIGNKNIKEKLQKDEEEAKMAKKLAGIVTDVPIKVEVDKLRLSRINTPKTEKLFERLGFKTLLKRLKGERRVKTLKKKKESELKKKGNPLDDCQLSLL